MRNHNVSLWLVTIVFALGLAVSTGLAQDNDAPADKTSKLSPLPTEAPGDSEKAPGSVESDGVGDPNAPDEGQQKQPGLLDGPMIYIMLGAIALMWFMSSRSRKKQEKKRKDMLATLSKGDKVTSIGGIVGTVVEVREDEVTVKVNDNTRLPFARWAIRGVGEEGKNEETKK